MIEAVRGKSVPAAGALVVAEAHKVEVVPLSWCFANPAGPVEDEAFERIAAMICAGLSNALDQALLDGVYLDLHGAAVADSFPDMEGELLRRVRAIIGAVPLTISLDPHCNLTREMVERTDAIAPFRTYPHVDMPAAGARAMTLLLERIKRGKPWAHAFRQVDFLMPITSQCTEMPPMRGVMAERAALASQHKAVELGVLLRFSLCRLRGLRAGHRRLRRDASRSRRGSQRNARADHGAGSGIRARRRAGGGRGGRSDPALERGEAAGRHRRYAGQSRRRRPWRHDRDAAGADGAERAGRRAGDHERCGGGGGVAQGWRRRDARS